MSSLQADWLPGSVSTGNCILLDWEHRITAFQPRGDLQGNFLPPLPFVGEEAEAYWRSSMASSPAGTRAQFSCPLSLSVTHTSRLAGCARSGHLYLEDPQAWHIQSVQAKLSLSNCPFSCVLSLC